MQSQNQSLTMLHETFPNTPSPGWSFIRADQSACMRCEILRGNYYSFSSLQPPKSCKGMEPLCVCVFLARIGALVLLVYRIPCPMLGAE